MKELRDRQTAGEERAASIAEFLHQSLSFFINELRPP
jgi:hypothetical protein